MTEDNNFELRKENFMLKQKNQMFEQENEQLHKKIVELENDKEDLLENWYCDHKGGCLAEELEKENEQLRNNGFTVSAMTEQQLKAALEKGEQLEKENAELKELLKNIIRVTWGEGWNYSLDVKVKAEQFLKEDA